MFHVDPIEAFESRKPSIDSAIVAAFEALGDEGVVAYHSVGLYHNTMSGFVPSILVDGLRPDADSAVPNGAQISFAEELFQERLRDPNTRNLFSTLVEGRNNENEPGVFFYGLDADVAGEYHKTYGVPERLYILAQEVGIVALDSSGRYSDRQKEDARLVFDSCKSKLDAAGQDIRVFEVDPFNSDIIKARVGGIPGVLEDVGLPGAKEAIIAKLASRFSIGWGGLYVPGEIPPEDLQLKDVQIPLPFKVTDEWVRGSSGRFS